MTTHDNSPSQMMQPGVKRTVFILACVAVGFYLAFIVMSITASV